MQKWFLSNHTIKISLKLEFYDLWGNYLYSAFINKKLALSIFLEETFLAMVLSLKS